ncbi:unnamed protein product (macronuclear) [Paramecium tetraurelia]|uniref:Biogenesis of lysosome-related organelles complex 1 subunit 7 n=1 Tax=Paramecium tetraurelia TaxID=5888 RepID=A0BEW4_PARTE|nr:uncharacterized protein GSPATT00028115001 [Paramecium tetraurelia]CAK57081.1 unnamed protein product [Paramecium tetraurelia]|eukprot:XP_001424479.1 hypothetical protein (macronuclear) [Paramecium tetraurelia strain d4-2]
MQTIAFFKDEDLKETFANQTSMYISMQQTRIQTLQHAQLEVSKINEKSPQLRKQAEMNFDMAQHTITRLADDLKAIHKSINRIKELNQLIDEQKKKQ